LLKAGVFVGIFRGFGFGKPPPPPLGTCCRDTLDILVFNVFPVFYIPFVMDRWIY
jgi:hypothetical protein